MAPVSLSKLNTGMPFQPQTSPNPLVLLENYAVRWFWVEKASQTLWYSDYRTDGGDWSPLKKLNCDGDVPKLAISINITAVQFLNKLYIFWNYGTGSASVLDLCGRLATLPRPSLRSYFRNRTVLLLVPVTVHWLLFYDQSLEMARQLESSSPFLLGLLRQLGRLPSSVLGLPKWYQTLPRVSTANLTSLLPRPWRPRSRSQQRCSPMHLSCLI